MLFIRLCFSCICVNINRIEIFKYEPHLIERGEECLRGYLLILRCITNFQELLGILIGILMAGFVLADGKTNWLEGAQLFIAYIVLGAAFLFFGI